MVARKIFSQGENFVKLKSCSEFIFTFRCEEEIRYEMLIDHIKWETRVSFCWAWPFSFHSYAISLSLCASASSKARHSAQKDILEPQQSVRFIDAEKQILMRSRCMNYDLVAQNSPNSPNSLNYEVRERKTDGHSPVLFLSFCAFLALSRSLALFLCSNHAPISLNAVQVSFGYNTIIILLNEYAI